MKISEKYAPMIIITYFSISMIIFVAVPLSALKYFLDDVSMVKTLEAPLFIALATIFIGLIYCEISFRIKNVLTASIVFGVISIHLFILMLFMSSLVLNRKIESIPFDFYLFLIIVLGGLLSIIYYRIKKGLN